MTNKSKVVFVLVMLLGAFFATEAFSAEVAAESIEKKVLPSPSMLKAPQALTVSFDEVEMVRLFADGTTKFSDSYKPTVAARVFWAAVAETNPYAQTYRALVLENARLYQYIDKLRKLEAEKLKKEEKEIGTKDQPK